MLRNLLRSNVYITEDQLEHTSVISSFWPSVPSSGAIVSFNGSVRPLDSQGANVKGLELVAYEPLTTNYIKDKATRAAARWCLQGVTIIHRIGFIPLGDTIVFVATAAEHRRAAFEAADFLMDYLKTDAYFWKKEITEAGEQWIEPRKEDYTDAERWDL